MVANLPRKPAKEECINIAFGDMDCNFFLSRSGQVSLSFEEYICMLISAISLLNRVPKFFGVSGRQEYITTTSWPAFTCAFANKATIESVPVAVASTTWINFIVGNYRRPDSLVYCLRVVIGCSWFKLER